MGRDAEAKKAFEKYLEMAPQAPERDYIKEYLED
jgi:predicted RNA polymerase sigma factor